MPGPPPKLPDRRQRTNHVTAPVVPFPREKAVPPMPEGLIASTRRLWASFWNSPVAQVVDPQSDMPAICRYFSLTDERERLYRGFRRKRLVRGSRGQEVLNPLCEAIHKFDAELRLLEDRLGLSPRARLQLGVQYGEAARTLQELNRILEEDQDEEENDPRQSVTNIRAGRLQVD